MAKQPGALGRILKKNVFERLQKRDLSVFARQLSLLLNLGVTVLKALHILEKRTHNARLKSIIKDIARMIEQGKPLSAAIEKYEDIFGKFFVVAVQAGEESGKIEKTLAELATYLEKEDVLRNRIRKAMAFPMVTLIIAIAVVAFLMVFVIPTFASVYEDAGVKLPVITSILIKVSSTVSSFWWVFLLIFAGIFFMFYKSGRFLHLTSWVDKMKLTIPIVRDLSMKLAVFRFARITATMLESGVSILTTLKMSASSTGNTILSRSVIRACESIDAGKTVEESLALHSKFPPFVVDMIGVGEEVGSIGFVLKRIAEYYERDVDDFVSNLATIIEPILTLFMGIVVVFIALSLFLPYFNIGDAILHQ